MLEMARKEKETRDRVEGALGIGYERVRQLTALKDTSRRLLDSALSGSTVIELPTFTHFLCVSFVSILFTLVSLIAIVLLFLVLLLSAFSVISASFCVHLLLPCRHVAPGLFESAVCRAVFLCSQFSTSVVTTTNQLIVYCKSLGHRLTQPDQALQKERKIGEKRLDSQKVFTMRPY